MSPETISRRKKVSVETLTGPQKSAILLMSLGTERAAKVLGSLKEAEITEIMAEVSRLDAVPAEIVDSVLDEFRVSARTRSFTAAGGVDVARELLDASLGSAKSDEIFEKMASNFVEVPFESARNADPRTVSSFLRGEHPQTITLVMAHLTPESAAVVFAALPSETQCEVAVRLATLERTSPETVALVEEIIDKRIGVFGPSEDMAAAGGVQSLVDLLNRTDRATERVIFEGLEAHDESLADEVRSRMFVFEDIISLDDMSVQQILRNVDTKTLAYSIKGVRPAVRDKILGNLSTRAAENLMEEVEILGPVRLATVEGAQRKVVEAIKELEENGTIQVARSNEEFVE